MADSIATFGASLMTDGRESEAMEAFDLAGDVLAVADALGGREW